MTEREKIKEALLFAIALGHDDKIDASLDALEAAAYEDGRRDALEDVAREGL